MGVAYKRFEVKNGIGGKNWVEKGGGGGEMGVMDNEIRLTELAPLDGHRSVLKFLNSVLKPKIQYHLETSPHLFGLGEDELERYIEENTEVKLSAVDNLLRMRFWYLYEHALHKDRFEAISGGELSAGICDSAYLHGRCFKVPEKVAWMLTPPLNYRERTNEALEYGIKWYRKILGMPDADDRGRLNMHLIQTKLRIIALLDMRVKGSPVQRNLNINVEDATREVTKEVEQLTTNEIEKQLRELANRERRALHITASDDSRAVIGVEQAGTEQSGDLPEIT